MAVVRQIGLHGSKLHFGLLDSLVESDPVLSINVRRAKEKITSRYKKKKIDNSDQNTVQELKKKINEIKNILDN